ncbi:MAG: hypothetical protein OXQ29_15415 [Rhodospirillaceae bacterium]|nr:hypothetical protein [Rhodospirillaceae bacterium]
MIVADASPLIVFAKIGRLRLLKELYDEVLIGPVVKEEIIDAGKVVRAMGVEQLESAMEDGWLQAVRLTGEEQYLMRRLSDRSRLDHGESESIAIASVRGLQLIVDDKEARSMAAAAGIEHIGSVGALLEAYLREQLDLEELEVTVQDITRILWLSPSVVAEVLRIAREAKR